MAVPPCCQGSSSPGKPEWTRKGRPEKGGVPAASGQDTLSGEQGLVTRGEAWTAQDSSGRGLRLLLLGPVGGSLASCPVWGPLWLWRGGAASAGCAAALGTRGLVDGREATSRHLRPEGEPQPSEPLQEKCSSSAEDLGDKPRGFILNPKLCVNVIKSSVLG